MKLYELTNEYNDLLALFDKDSEIPEDALCDTLEAVCGEIKEKADNIACLLKNLDAEILAIKAEEDRLAERRKAKKNAYDRIKTYIAAELQKCSIDKVETARNKITFRASEVVVIDGDENAFIERMMSNGKDDLLTYQLPKVNKTAIKDAMKRGETVEGAHIEKKMNLQIK